MDKTIEEYIEKQNSLEKELLKKARTLILNTIPLPSHIDINT